MAKIQIVEDSHYNGHRNYQTEFSKKDGIKYCLSCGEECLTDIKYCESCGKDRFIPENISSVIGGYIKLAENDAIKKYYKNFNSNSIIKMNPKRMIHQLLQHKDRIDIRKETIDKIYGVNVRNRNEI